MPKLFQISILLLAISVLFNCSGLAQWSTFTPMPTARWGPGAASEGGKLYVASGYGWNQMEAYTPGTNSWQALAPIPLSTGYPATTAYAGKVYVIGGANASTWLTNNQIYDIATNTWSAGAPMPSGRADASCVAYNGKIYVSHGWNAANLNSLVIYDIASNTWSTGANAPTVRSHTCAALIGSRMYVVGGYTNTIVGTLEVYDIPTNTWLTRASIPTGRYLHAAGSDGSMMHVVAGFTGSATNSYQSYDPVSNTWTVGPNAPTARYRVAGTVVNGCMYVAGGFNSVTLGTLEGFCGLPSPPLPALEWALQGRMEAGRAVLRWSLPDGLEDRDVWIEHSGGDGFWEQVGRARASDAYWQAAANAHAQGRFRLRWQDGNGVESYSNIVEVGMEAAANVVARQQGDALYLFANPLAMNLGGYRVRVCDLGGRVLISGELVPGEPANWSGSALNAGMYIVHWSSAGSSGSKVIHWQR